MPGLPAETFECSGPVDAGSVRVDHNVLGATEDPVEGPQCELVHGRGNQILLFESRNTFATEVHLECTSDTLERANGAPWTATAKLDPFKPRFAGRDLPTTADRTIAIVRGANVAPTEEAEVKVTVTAYDADRSCRPAKGTRTFLVRA